jgi:transmembrane sensor
LENNIDIDNLIGKYLSGEANPDEAIYLEEWKESRSENSKYFEDYEKLYKVRFSALNDTMVNMAWNDVQAQLDFVKPIHATKLRNTYWAIAASLIFVMGLMATYFYFSKPMETQEYIALNETKSIKLKDNSEVAIYKNSTIRMDNEFDGSNRTVKLKGSAYFKVIHDATKPFIVNMGAFNVKDIGTKFKIVTSENGDTITVSVDEGVVFVYDSLGFEKTINANEKIVYILSNHSSKDHKASAENELKSFKFQNTSLKEVISQLSNAYGVQIIIDNEKISECRITAQFNNESFENVLLIVTETLGIEANKSENGYIIIGDKCRN